MYLIIPPDREIDKVLALPVLDLICSCGKIWDVFIMEDDFWRKLFSETVWVRFVKDEIEAIKRIALVDLRLSRVEKAGKVDYRRFLKKAADYFPKEAINFFLSGDFPRNAIWFNEDELEYGFLVKELACGKFVVVAVDGKGRFKKIKNVVKALLSESELMIVVVSGDDGEIAEDISLLDKKRCLALSSKKYFRYALSVMSMSLGVLGTDEVMVMLGGYLSKSAFLITDKFMMYPRSGIWTDFFDVCEIRKSTEYIVLKFLNLIGSVCGRTTTREMSL